MALIFIIEFGMINSAVWYPYWLFEKSQEVTEKSRKVTDFNFFDLVETLGTLLYGKYATSKKFPKIQESMLKAETWYMKSVYFDNYAKKISAF